MYSHDRRDLTHGNIFKINSGEFKDLLVKVIGCPTPKNKHERSFTIKVALLSTGRAIRVNLWMLSPVSLTEDLLLKLGFEESLEDSCADYTFEDLNFYLLNSGANPRLFLSLYGANTECYYVHQVQSLIYVLRGRVLTL